MEEILGDGRWKCISYSPPSSSDPSQEHDDEIVEQIRHRHKWDNNDSICHDHILDNMCDSLFGTYQTVPYAKELWNLLKTRYMKEDATS